MQKFYNKALAGLVSLLAVTCLLGYFCVDNTFLRLSLFPAAKSTLPWYAEPHTDIYQGGNSSLTVLDDKFSLDANFTLSRQAQYPLAAITMVFGKPGKVELVDLSPYDKIVFNAKCTHANSLSFSVATFDEQVSQREDFVSYRAPATFFSCTPEWTPITLDLTRMEIPQWWFDKFNVELSHNKYILDKVAKFSFGNSFQTPFEVETNIQLNEMTLIGHNWAYLYGLAAFVLLSWGGYAFWFFRQHTLALTHELHDKIQRDRPLVAYQQLSVEPLRDKDRSAILHYMATQYANTDLTIEAMSSAIGVSRTKINDILKSELGFTFTGYLNKLRLTEATRLLVQEEDANIAEIAYSVGYKTVSYFNKLFKEEYRCTPKTYKSLCDKTAHNKV